MYVSHLSLTNFRNFRQLDLDLSTGVTVFAGRNAQGKTSLLEAVYLLAIARSFRAENEYQVVNWAASAEAGTALVAGTVQRGGEQIRINIGYQCVTPSYPGSTSAQTEGGSSSPTVRKQFRVSRLKRTASELVGVVNAVLFSADDMELVYGAPSLRRRYLDILISQVNPIYLKTLQRYQRVLYQRNRLLKMMQDGRAREDELVFWNEQLVKEGAWITARRYETMASLAHLCNEQQIYLTDGAEQLTLEYRPSIPGSWNADGDAGLEIEFRKGLETSQRRELGRGSTMIGPHRDEFKLWVDQIDMGTYASRGQARTLALALRLGEAAYLSSSRGEGPIVLLDDVLSELDSFRRERVLAKAAEYPQTLITTSDIETVGSGYLENATLLNVEGGIVESLN